MTGVILWTKLEPANPHPLINPLITECWGVGGVGPSKNRVTWGIQNFLLEWGDKLEKAGEGRGGGGG